MMSQTGQQIFTINILLNKDKQTMKFGQLREYRMRNILFLENYTQYFLGKISLRPFNKNSKLSISLDQQSEMLQSFSLLYDQVEVY